MQQSESHVRAERAFTGSYLPARARLCGKTEENRAEELSCSHNTNAVCKHQAAYSAIVFLGDK